MDKIYIISYTFKLYTYNLYLTVKDILLCCFLVAMVVLTAVSILLYKVGACLIAFLVF